MKIEDLNDFYIDLDGDIKTSTVEGKAEFITETDKLNSEYFIAANILEIKLQLKKINPTYDLDIPVFKQYSLKTDKDKQVKAIKIYVDYNDVDEPETRHILLEGIEFTNNDIFKEYYLTTTIDNIRRIIKEMNL